MKLLRLKWPALLFALPALVVQGCSSPEPENTGAFASQTVTTPDNLADALTLHASFDQGADADFALGDPGLYTASSFEEAEEVRPGLENPFVEMAVGQGRFGDALRFTERNTSPLFYRAAEKVAYREDDWSGSISFWLSLSPAEDLAPGYCDPIQITDATYNDAAVWVDFTNANPRQFRLGVFGDLSAWNPEGLSSDEHPRFEESLVVVREPPFQGDRWTHVVITYAGLNSGVGGSARLYLDGVLQGTILEIGEPFTWDLLRAQIRIGVNYVGLFDELALFDRPLSDSEVLALHQLDEGVAALH